MRKCSCLIIGAGASGLTAAIACRDRGGDVLLAERLSKPGKKILASGGGRCNLLNRRILPEMFNASGRDLAASVFGKFGLKELLAFLERLGIEVFADGERIFPATNQSATVLRAFELELQRLGVPVEFNFEAIAVEHDRRGFTVTGAGGRVIECRKLIIAGGGRSYPALGSNGSCFRLAKALGHRVVEPVPSCVALISRDRLCHHLQGQKISARAACLVDGKTAAESAGEVLFTQYGLSGTAVLDISTEASLALNRRKAKSVTVSLDLVPYLDRETLCRKLGGRLSGRLPPADMLTGILPNKFGPAFSDLIRSGNPAKVAGVLKDRRFEITGTRGWNEAEFTSGGVDTSEIDPVTLESKLVPGLHFCGEVLDVDGRRGGFNLAWAWASGLAAGLS